MISLPFETTGKWSVEHGLDFLVDVVNTRAMDFGQPGFARMSRKPVCIFNEDTDTDFGTVMAIVPLSTGTSTTYYFITSEHCFSWDASVSALTELDTSSMPSVGLDSDGVIFDGRLHVSGGDTVNDWSGSAWHGGGARITGLGTSFPHPLCALDFQPYLAVGKQNAVLLYDASYSLVITCTLPKQYIVTGIRCRRGNLYIATRAIDGTTARLFVWNGSGTVAQDQWDARADWIYSLADFDSSIYIVTSAGQLLRFNGGGFDEKAAFPVYYSPYSWATSSALPNAIGRCAPRGMIARGGQLFININGSINTSGTDGVSKFMADQPSGLWCYDPAVGLYHKGGLCYTKFKNLTYTLASNVLTFAAAHLLQTGDPVFPTDVTGVSGINANQMYYAIIISATTIKLAFSRAEALAGASMTITGTPSGGNSLIIDAFESMGSVYSGIVPGAVGLYVTDNPPSILGSEVMYCADVLKSDGATSISSLMSFGASHGMSSFTTTPMPASQVTDSYQKLMQYLAEMELDAAQINIKYRIAPRYGFPTQFRKASAGLAVWVDTQTFIIDTLSKDFIGVIKGDEVEIIEGAAAGYVAHIRDIDSTGPLRIVLDEPIPGITAGMKSEVIADNWQKIGTITTETPDIEQQFAETAVGATSSRLQFKIELRGIGVAVRKLQSVAVPAKQAL